MDFKKGFKKAASVAFILGPALLFSRENRTYHYLAHDIPASGSNCHEQAKNLAARFTEITQISSVGRCKSVSQKGVDILISYESSESLHVVSSKADIGFPSQGYEFATKENCEIELPGEVDSFKKLTGSEPLLSFCRGDENYFGRVRWALIVEGFGKPEHNIAWASSLFPGQPTRQQVEKIKNDVKSQLSNEKVTIRHIFLQEDDHGHLRLNINYYGKFGEQIKAFALASVNSLSQCEKDLNSSIQTLTYCVNNPYHRGADMVAVIDVTNWHRLRQSAETFGTYEECDSAKPALLELYESSYPQKILGGFCTKWGSNWKVNLVEENSTRS